MESYYQPSAQGDEISRQAVLLSHLRIYYNLSNVPTRRYLWTDMPELWNYGHQEHGMTDLKMTSLYQQASFHIRNEHRC
jgi:hypothetical protein